MENRSMFVGLDVHKETIDVSIAKTSSFTRFPGGTVARWRILEGVKDISAG